MTSRLTGNLISDKARTFVVLILEILNSWDILGGLPTLVSFQSQSRKATGARISQDDFAKIVASSEMLRLLADFCG